MKIIQDTQKVKQTNVKEERMKGIEKERTHQPTKRKDEGATKRLSALINKYSFTLLTFVFECKTTRTKT